MRRDPAGSRPVILKPPVRRIGALRDELLADYDDRVAVKMTLIDEEVA